MLNFLIISIDSGRPPISPNSKKYKKATNIMKQSKGMLMKLVMQEKDHQQFCTNSSESKHIFALKIGKYHLKKNKPQKKTIINLIFWKKIFFC